MPLKYAFPAIVKRRHIYAVIFVSALMPQLSHAQTVEELLDIVRRQSQEIEALKARVESLERQATNASVAKNTAAANSTTAAPSTAPDIIWKGAPVITSADGAFSFKPRGRVHADAWALSSRTEGVDYASGTELRRARLGADGTLYHDFLYSIEVDFAGRNIGLEDVIVAYTGLPGATITLGYHKSPNTLEDLTSDNYVTFMERAAYAATLSPGRGIGASVRLSRERWMITAGIFGEAENDSRDGKVDEDWVVGARATAAPVLGKDEMVHVGVSGYYLNAAADEPRFRLNSRPEFHLGTPLVDTGTLNVADAAFVGAETAAVWGPFHAAAEWGWQWASLRAGGTAVFNGGYAQAGWFLTGERRPYNAGSGTFGRLQPASPLSDGGPGAFEVAARYSRLDFNDSLVMGGDMTSWTLGINWYPTAYTRLMLNWVRFKANDSLAALPLDVADHKGDAFGMRAQIDW